MERINGQPSDHQRGRSIRTPNLLVEALIAVSVVGIAAALFFALLDAIIVEPECDAGTPSTERTDWRPDIRHCHADGVDLWDCIRQSGMYREDI